MLWGECWVTAEVGVPVGAARWEGVATRSALMAAVAAGKVRQAAVEEVKLAMAAAVAMTVAPVALAVVVLLEAGELRVAGKTEG